MGGLENWVVGDWRLEIGDWFREVNGFWGGEVSCPVGLDGAIIRGIGCPRVIGSIQIA